MADVKKKLVVEEVLDVQECIIEPQISRLTIGDVEIGKSIELTITSIAGAKTNFGIRYDFIGRDKNNNPLTFSSWNLRNVSKMPIKIGTILKLSNNGEPKFEAEVVNIQ
jgi:hypothetical protein